MPDEVVVALKEIAALLQRRVEQTDAAAQCSAEHMAIVKTKMPHENPDFVKEMEESRARAARAFDQMDSARQEERAFRERLLQALDRQNALLDQLVTHLRT